LVIVIFLGPITVKGQIRFNFDDNFIRTIATNECKNPTSIAYNERLGIVYAACAHPDYYNIVAISGSSVSVLASCYNPVSIAFVPVFEKIYAACFDQGVISIHGETVNHLTVCSRPYAVTFNQVTSGVYVACYDNGGDDMIIRSSSLDEHQSISIISVLLNSSCLTCVRTIFHFSFFPHSDLIFQFLSLNVIHSYLSHHPIPSRSPFAIGVNILSFSLLQRNT
jgi:hypothetical protein